MKINKMIVTKIGGPETLQLVSEDLPEPKEKQVQVRILTAGIAFADVMIRYGQYPGVNKPPVTPGYDLVGIVEAVGDQVTAVQPGDTVAALTVYGAYATHINLPEEWLVKLPNGIDPVKSVALVLNYVTAYQMLHRIAKVKSGQSILIHGAGGGVGSALMQLGNLANLTMTGTASKKKHELLAKNHVTPIDYRTQDFEMVLKNTPVDAVFENIGGENVKKSFNSLKKGGVLVIYGARAFVSNGTVNNSLMSKAFMQSILLTILPNGKKSTFYAINARKQADAFREDLTKLVRLLEDRKIDPVIGAVLPLEEAAEGNRLIETAAVEGKVVLTNA